MSDLNRWQGIGRLGADPEIRYTQAGKAVANIRLATSSKWRDKNSGEQQERTEWHRIVAFGKLAEIIEKYVHKGDQIFIEGELQTRKWQDQSGQDRYITEVVASQMQMLGGKRKQSERPAQSAQAPSEPPPDDDIPF